MFLPAHCHKSILTVTLSLLISLATAAGSVLMAAPEDPVTEKNLEEKIASAKTADDHKALGDYYRSEAEKARVKVEKHQKMAAAYRKSGFAAAARTKMPGSPRTIEHCEKLAKRYESLTEMLEMMAKDHDAMAAKSR